MTVEIKAPMPGEIIEIFVSEGDDVEEFQELLILEAMKMENVISSKHNGKVKEILVKVGDAVATNQVLIILEQKT